MLPANIANAASGSTQPVLDMAPSCGLNRLACFLQRHAEAEVIAARAAEAAAWTQGHKAGIAEQAALLKQHQAQLTQARTSCSLHGTQRFHFFFFGSQVLLTTMMRLAWSFEDAAQRLTEHCPIF